MRPRREKSEPGHFVRRAVLTGSALASTFPAVARAAAPEAPRVCLAPDSVRVRGDEPPPGPCARGEAAPLELRALLGETVAFQAFVEAGGAPAPSVRAELEPFRGESGEGEGRIEASAFRAHALEIRVRSRNERRPAEALGWSPEARPADADTLGLVPDPLVPLEVASGFLPYPFTLAPGERAALWFDVRAGEELEPGRYRSALRVRAEGTEIARIPVELEVAPARLPYRPVSFVAYYGRGELEGRLGASPEETDLAERRLLQLLHAHGLDALASLDTVEDVERLASHLDGSLYTPAEGYRGPGVGVPPAAVAIGAYGGMGAPTPEAVERVAAIERRLPEGELDVFLYAVDEQCESPLGPAWKKALAARPDLARVRVAHSCAEDPARQNVDLVLTPADAFDPLRARAARDAGREVWAYNGALPRAGTLLLDAPIASLRVNAWIAAAYDVGRWFLWETTFWNDDNRGGRGPVDPFVQPENFHNAHGDAALGDGLLVYPGRQAGPFARHSLGHLGVLPSMRLKSLRRGIQDAGYVALARSASPTSADRVLRNVVPAALAPVARAGPPPFSLDGLALDRARDALRARIPAVPGAVHEVANAAETLREGARLREAALRRQRNLRRLGLLAGALLLGAGLLVALRRLPRRPAPRPNAPTRTPRLDRPVHGNPEGAGVDAAPSG